MNLTIPANLPIPDRCEFWQVLDSTKLQAYGRCPRRYFYEYVMGWRSDKPNNHLIFGQGWHEALAFLYKEGFDVKNLPNAYAEFVKLYRKEFPESTDDWFGGKTPLAAMSALLEYAGLYASDAYEFEVLDVEVGGAVPIGGSRTITVKMDLVYRRPNNLVGIMEHKTGSQAGRTWEMQWATSLQIGAYLHAVNCFYNSTNSAEAIVNGTFFYKKDQKFARIKQVRSSLAMQEWLFTVHKLMDSIEDDFVYLGRQQDSETSMRAFAMNPSGCVDYGGCPYFDLCSIGINPLRYADQPLEGFIYHWWDPTEGSKKILEQTT